jgi:hypothetical protein
MGRVIAGRPNDLESFFDVGLYTCRDHICTDVGVHVFYDIDSAVILYDTFNIVRREFKFEEIVGVKADSSGVIYAKISDYRDQIIDVVIS